MSSHQSAPTPEDFIPDKFKRKSTGRDYLIYLVVLVLFVGVVGGGAYYFTRPKPEQEKLLAKFKKPEVTLPAEPVRLQGRKTPELDGLLGKEEAAAEAAVVASRQAESKPVAVSTYSGGGPNRVVVSADPKLPAASAVFIQFAEALKVSGVVAGNPAKVMISGRMFRAGETIDPEQSVTFVGVDGDKKLLLLRDNTGAELSLTY